MDKRKIFRTLVIGLMAAAVFGSAITAYAWLKMDKGAEFQMGADSEPDISIKTAQYQNGSYVWETDWQRVGPDHTNKTLFGKPFDPSRYDGSQPNGQETAGLKAQCQFGEINNLNSLDDSNYGWYCIRIHEEEGLYFNGLGVRYSADPYLFYGANWVQNQVAGILPENQFAGSQKTQLDNALRQADQSLPNLMCVEGAWVSAQAPKNGAAPFPLQKKSQNYVLVNGDGKTGPFAGKALNAQNEKQVDQDGYYYVYFCVYPNLASYHGMVNALNAFMPCYLSFHPLNIEITVTTQTPAQP